MDGADVAVRIARPSGDLERARRFWCSGLGLEVLYESDDSAEGGHALLMLGWPGASWHLELVGDEVAHQAAGPTAEDLLVLYLGRALDASLVDRLVAEGGRRVESANPYWDRLASTVEDPDGYRLVLCRRTWP